MLYQKIRPTIFDNVIGNKTNISALKKVLCRKPKDRPHVFLFSGPTGCGKTTLARILADQLGCEGNNLVELNAANTRGIDTTREVYESVQSLCFDDGPKCFIFDECHELTSSAQEALLKILEDTPENCYFMFCTTEPKSLIPAILNRCKEATYEVCKLGINDLVKLIQYTYTTYDNSIELCVDKDGTTSPEEVNEIIKVIAEESEGCPRTAISLLERINGLSTEEAIEVLAIPKELEKSFQDLCKLLIQGPDLRIKNFSKIMETFDKINEDSERIRKYLMSFLAGKMSSFAAKNKIEDCRDIKNLMKIFSVNTFYGGKSQLCSMIAEACL